jgi:hypothetical protein
MFSELTKEGLIFVSIAWSSIAILTGWCIYKVLKSGDKLGED